MQVKQFTALLKVSNLDIFIFCLIFLNVFDAGVEHFDVILENSLWLVKQHPLEALTVFTGMGASITDAESFPRDKVLDFIKLHQPRLGLLYLVSDETTGVIL